MHFENEILIFSWFALEFFSFRFLSTSVIEIKHNSSNIANSLISAQCANEPTKYLQRLRLMRGTNSSQDTQMFLKNDGSGSSNPFAQGSKMSQVIKFDGRQNKLPNLIPRPKTLGMHRHL